MNFAMMALLFMPEAEGNPDVCEADAKVLCAESVAPDARISCLIRNRDQLSEGCRNDLKRLNQLVKDSGARTGGLSSFGGVIGGLGLVPPKKSILSLEGMNAYEGHPTVINQGKVSLISPMWIKDDHSFVGSVSAGTVKINEAVVTPDGSKIRELQRIEAGGQYTKNLSDHRLMGLRGSIGSAGDDPFATGKEYTFSVNGFYARPGSEDSYWVYTFFLANNSPLLNYVPIPGFIYLYRKENFTGMIGVPLMSLQWTPSKEWMFSFSFFITNLRSAISYNVSDRHQASIGFSINQQTYLREKREDNRDRLFLNDKRIYAGWRSVLTESFSAEIQFGESFDRELREGKRFNDKDWRRELGRSMYVSSALTFMY